MASPKLRLGKAFGIFCTGYLTGSWPTLGLLRDGMDEPAIAHPLAG
jgi:hypothetical protein